MSNIKAFGYLLGIITGRGHILPEERRVIIEFAHSNEYLTRIVYCDQCGDLVTGFTREKARCKSSNAYGNAVGNRKCSSNYVADSQFKYVEQRKSTRESIRDEIIPFLRTLSSAEDPIGMEISWSNSCTFLVINFDNNSNLFTSICSEFRQNINFHDFLIPEFVKNENTSRSVKIEFINGMLDTSGFMQKGGWAPYQGSDIHGRMRGYFEFPRNWKMPVETCNFLKKLGFPTHTIDWGHPQVRDSNLEDFHKKGRMGWREHQLKFFPEYFDECHIRIYHKRELFLELQKHNKNQFNTDSDCNPPKKVNKSMVSPHHPQIDSNKVPEELRGIDIDSYWQVCHLMGCKYTSDVINSVDDLIFINGTGKGEYNQIIAEFEEIRENKNQDIEDKWKNYERLITSKKKKGKINESDLYEPIAKWLEVDEEFLDGEVTYDTATNAMDGYINEEGLTDLYYEMADFNQKPDVVGLRHQYKYSVFIEVKLGALNLQDLGQLQGYCVMANPNRAILTSPKGPSRELVSFLLSFPEVLNFANGKRIEVGTWNKQDREFVDGEF